MGRCEFGDETCPLVEQIVVTWFASVYQAWQLVCAIELEGWGRRQATLGGTQLNYLNKGLRLYMQTVFFPARRPTSALERGHPFGAAAAASCVRI